MAASGIHKEARTDNDMPPQSGASSISGASDMGGPRRCSRCILPETMPFIEFDEDGICNYCHSYRKVQLRPREELAAIADGIRGTGGTHDCIVMFSGGRDSSYMLHYVVRTLKLRPLVFTYDWGMSTPVGDANAARMCEKLGVDRIVVNGNTKKKLRNIRLNVEAWEKRPELGTVPLFMAGDKHFNTEVMKLSKRTGIHTIFVGTNPFEKTDFKSGFCGVRPNFDAEHIQDMGHGGKGTMIRYYLKQFLRNPAYINASLVDSGKAFFAFYNAPAKIIDLYKYVMWNEEEIDKLLLEEYGWERAEDTPTTWRIGDGTAAFYNHIYYSAAGFTENDTLRSNQIREGAITRDEALRRVAVENQPRLASMRWYFQRIGTDMDRALAAVEKLPKLCKGKKEC